MIDPDERERRVIEVLGRWPTALAGVLIGGYAVAAYGRPRYSVDVDIVATTSAAEGWTGWLKGLGLALERAPRRFEQGKGTVAFQRWHDSTVVVDLLIGGVRDRRAETVISDDWIAREPRVLPLELLSGRLDGPVAVVRPEGLWALKLLAGRPTDLTDLFGISRQRVRLAEVRELFETLQSPPLERKLAFVASQLRDEKLYKDALSRLRLGSPGSEGNRAAWGRFLTMARSAMPPTTHGASA